MIKRFQCKNVKNVKSKLFKSNCQNVILLMFMLIYRRETKGEPTKRGKKSKGKFQKAASKKPKAGSGERNPKKRFGGRKRR